MVTNSLLQELQNTTNPAEKAALIAEITLSNLPPPVALVARRCLILHWFNQDIVAALLPAEADAGPEAIYRQLAGLSFMETLPYGLAYHDLTRVGLLARATTSQPDLLRQAAALAAPIYASAEDKAVALEGLYCYILAGAEREALKLLETLIYWAGAREDWAMLLNIFAIWDEAEQVGLSQALPRSALHFFAGGLARQSLKQYEAALADYGRAIELNPQDADAYNNRGNTYKNLKQYEAALADYGRAIELNPQDATAYNNRGLTYSDLKQYEAALADYGRAIELNPQDATAFYNRGLTYSDLKQYEAALADYGRAIELNPQDAPAYNNRGNTYYDLKQYEAALADYGRAIELNPQYAPTYNNRGITYRNLKQYEAALADYQRAIELKPDYADVYNNRGYAYLQQGKFEQALADINKALELDPEDAVFYHSKAQAYALQNKVAETLPPLRRALELDPNILNDILTDSDFDLIRDDPRFKALLAEFTPKDAQSTQQPETP